jgi:hypothetical protein
MSLVSTSHKFIYPSGGRCATGSIHAALMKIPNFQGSDPARSNPNWWKKYNKHTPLRHIQRMVSEEQWNTYFKFSFVRNTYSHIVSSFFFWTKIGMYKNPKNGIMTMDDFQKAVDYYTTPVGRRHDECTNIRSQHSFISDSDGKILLDFVGHYETLRDDFNHICQQIGVQNIELTKQNASLASKGVHWKEHYRQNPEAKDFVYHWWKRDIDAFDFKLEL